MAAPECPKKPKSLEDVPSDMRYAILLRVPCKRDRLNIALVCKGWKEIVRGVEAVNRPPRALPCLLLPSLFPDPTTASRRVLCPSCLHAYPTVLPPGARCCGAYEGGWVMVDFGEMGRHALVNVVTGVELSLPSSLATQRLPGDPVPEKSKVIAAALSSSPEDPHCKAVIISASWRDPAPGAVAAAPPPRPRFIAAQWNIGSGQAEVIPHALPEAEDVVYHGGAFNLLTPGDHLLIFKQVQDPLGFTTLGSERRMFFPGGRFYPDSSVRARYLVSCSEELLLVLRMIPGLAQPSTSGFKVYRAIPRKIPEEDLDVYPWAWAEVDSLGGRTLFVANGCSSAYRCADHPGLKEGVVFLDDGGFHDKRRRFLGNAATRPYPCVDNGFWCEGRVRRCFPRSAQSHDSPPIWLVPSGENAFTVAMPEPELEPEQ
ncbi:hypothetical protein BS78_03G190300 [Paspalum vaginatum]|nr:hypothetical protein BS78_03G190300 [Paspalum vaginatum]